MLRAIVGLVVSLVVLAPAAAQDLLSLPPELVDCLVEAVGQQAFDDISAGLREPTDQEIARGTVCFDQYGPPPVVTTTATEISDQVDSAPPPAHVTELPDEVRSCLVAAVGEQTVNEVMAGKRQPTASEIELGSKCFPTGALVSGGTGSVGPPPGLSPELASCLRQAVGDARFEAIMAGGQPSQEEMSKGDNCFRQYGGVASSSYSISVSALAPETESCLSQAVGDELLKQMKAGQTQLSKEQFEATERCFAQTGGGPVSSPPQLSDEAKACAIKIFGEQRFNDLFAGRAQPTEQERQQFNSQCVPQQLTPSPGATSSGSSSGDPLHQCLIAKLGEARFKQLQATSGASATAEELQIGEDCKKSVEGR